MAKFIHADSSIIRGPFLIDKGQLEELDQILEKEWRILKHVDDDEIKKEIDDEFHAYRSRYSYRDESDDELRDRIKSSIEAKFKARENFKITIIFSDKTSTEFLKLEPVFRDADLQEKRAVGFKILMETNNRKCSINLIGSPAQLGIDIYPKNDPIIQETLIAFKKWQKAVAPSWAQSFWRESSGIHWSIWISLVLFSLIYISSAKSSANNDAYRERAYELLKNEIPVDKYGEALTLLLSNSYKIYNTPNTFKTPGWFWILLIGGLIYCVLFSIKPNVVIELGRGEKTLTKWRKYSKFILLSTPLFILTMFIWPKIEFLINKLLEQ